MYRLLITVPAVNGGYRHHYHCLPLALREAVMGMGTLLSSFVAEGVGAPKVKMTLMNPR